LSFIFVFGFRYPSRSHAVNRFLSALQLKNFGSPEKLFLLFISSCLHEVHEISMFKS